MIGRDGVRLSASEKGLLGPSTAVSVFDRANIRFASLVGEPALIGESCNDDISSKGNTLVEAPDNDAFPGTGRDFGRFPSVVRPFPGMDFSAAGSELGPGSGVFSSVEMGESVCAFEVPGARRIDSTRRFFGTAVRED